jgi:hypothetical protein
MVTEYSFSVRDTLIYAGEYSPHLLNRYVTVFTLLRKWIEQLPIFVAAGSQCRFKCLVLTSDDTTSYTAISVLPHRRHAPCKQRMYFPRSGCSYRYRGAYSVATSFAKVHLATSVISPASRGSVSLLPSPLERTTDSRPARGQFGEL